MKLNLLPQIVARAKKRRGQGVGSGKGFHTSGRGAKGANVRKTTPPFFTGTKGKKSLIKRLPLWRGKGRLKPSKKKKIE